MTEQAHFRPDPGSPTNRCDGEAFVVTAGTASNGALGLADVLADAENAARPPQRRLAKLPSGANAPGRK